MAYVLVNPDNTVNWIGDEIESWVNLENVVVHELPDKTTTEVMGGVPPEFCVWDSETKTVCDERERPELVKLVNKFFDSREEELTALAAAARARRDSNLRTSDARIAATDNPHLNVEAWKAYRQQLRDVPQQPGFPENINWPTPPE